jgi:hypothetical protein
MNRFIVTTTINYPTKALEAFASMSDWKLIVVGDLNTPHLEYQRRNCIYLHPNEQAMKYREISECIGWNSIQRRNIGFLEAYELGADVIATVDDDNIPYSNWGRNLLVGQEIECDMYEPEEDVFDPLSITKLNSVWHRGYPIELVPNRLSVRYLGKTRRKVLVQADLWDGDPDIDAIARLSIKPTAKYDDIREPYCSNRISPFNSQNTFLAREVIPFYAVLPHVGRMDDIWGSYVLQSFFPNSIVYNSASVYQDRNSQDLIVNLEKEILGYKSTLSMIRDLPDFAKYLPEETLRFWKLYRKAFEHKIRS